MSKISVIIPTYNRAELLIQTVHSVFAQTRIPDEIIVVDDGSSDDTAERVRLLGEKVTYVYQRNAGLSATRNTGLRHCTGDFICFLDSDDLLLPNALESLSGILETHPDVSFVYGRSQTINERNEITEDIWRREDFEGFVWEKMIEGNFIRTAGTVLIRRDALVAVGGFNTSKNLRANEDWEVWLHLSEDMPVARLPEAVLQYRVHSNSMSSDPLLMHHSAILMLQNQRRRHRHNSLRHQKIEAVYDRFAVYTTSLYLHALQEKHQQRKYRAAFRLFWRAARLRPQVPVTWLRDRIQKTLATRTHIVLLSLYRRLPRLIRVGIRRVLGIDPWRNRTGDSL